MDGSYGTAISPDHRCGAEGDTALLALNSEVMQLLAGVAAGVLFSIARIATASTVRALIEQIRRRPRLTIRAALVMMAISLSVVMLFINVFYAGVALICTAAVRLGHPRAKGWKVEDLDMHILTEIFFHVTALSGLALGINLMVVGAVSGLQTGHLVTVTLALTLGALAAINKSSSRTRKLCTEITKRASRVSRSIVALHSFQSLCEKYGTAQESYGTLMDRQHDCHESIDDLARVLDTRFNTGYRQLGSRLLPETKCKELIESLHKAVRDAKPGEGWFEAFRFLDKIEKACSKHVDEVA